ncbi:hypothetical protein HGRIS_010985 [Hohenbuehelia grisea]|uniref:AA9 family lytic polysaccharide monooxygenase n=1 Tax=Hohenbuehelia grisea TaxID=104357 RepID=A0ABR3IYR9_9AGAR
MKSFLLLLPVLVQMCSAHYIWHILNAGGTSSSAAVRKPFNNSPVEQVSSTNMRCNVNPGQATQTVTVSAGSSIGFSLDNSLFHPGPAAIYLGKAPGSVASWDGSGNNWFKIAEWGAQFNPFKFIPDGLSQLSTTIPSNTPSGEYLVRIEHIALHSAGAPQYYISCAQINIVNGGGGNPTKVSIPGYVSASDPGLTVNIHWPTPTAYTVPGPRPWRG